MSRKDFINAQHIDKPASDLLYLPAQKVEVLHDIMARKTAGSDYIGLRRYAHLRESPIDLEAIALTDKQLMAVAMVFYGRVKKSRAAQAMKISNQALDDLIRLALKKIEDSLIR